MIWSIVASPDVVDYLSESVGINRLESGDILQYQAGDLGYLTTGQSGPVIIHNQRHNIVELIFCEK